MVVWRRVIDHIDASGQALLDLKTVLAQLFRFATVTVTCEAPEERFLQLGVQGSVGGLHDRPLHVRKRIHLHDPKYEEVVSLA